MTEIRPLKRQKGVSLIELVLVAAAVGFLALLVANLPPSVAAITRSQHMSVAHDIVSKEIEYLRKQTYANLSNTVNPFTDPALAGLPQSAASYEVGDCPSNICANQEKAKMITVTVSWKEPAGQKNIRLVTIISQGGLGQ